MYFFIFCNLKMSVFCRIHGLVMITLNQWFHPLLLISLRYLKNQRFKKRTLPECQRILLSDNRYSNEQPVILRNKQKGLRNCRSCKSSINVGKLCLNIEYLVVAYNKQNEMVQALFCCPKKQCTMQMPLWIHLKPIAQIVVNADFEATEKQKVLIDFHLN